MSGRQKLMTHDINVTAPKPSAQGRSKMRIELDLTVDQISEIVLADLKKYYNMLVEPIGAEDEADQKALLRVIEMYTSPEQYAAFLESIK